MEEYAQFKDLEPINVKGCERLVVDVIKNQNKKFVPAFSENILHRPREIARMEKQRVSTSMMSDCVTPALLVA